MLLELSMVIFYSLKLNLQNQRSFKDYTKRIDEELNDVARHVFIFLGNHPSHVDVHLFKWGKDWEIHITSFPPGIFNYVFLVMNYEIFTRDEALEMYERKHGERKITEEPIKQIKMEKATTKSKPSESVAKKKRGRPANI